MSKLGVHIVQGERNGYGAFLDTIRSANVLLPVVKTVDQFGTLQEAKDRNPLTVTIGRVHSYESNVDYNSTPVDFANFWFGRATAADGQWTLNKTRVDYWETLNEESSNWQWQADFYIRMMELAESKGYKLALWCTSTGNPPLLADDGGLALNQILRTAQRAKQGGHIFSFHEYGLYGSGLLSDPLNKPFLSLRYRLVYDYLSQNNAIVPLVISEAGQNGGYNFVGNQTFISDVSWYDLELMKDDYVIGATLWTLGNWNNANFQTALPELAQLIIQHSQPIQPPPTTDVIKGPHGRGDGGPFPQSDQNALVQSGLKGFKLMTNFSKDYHNQLDGLGIPRENRITRLFKDFSGVGIKPTPESFVTDQRLAIQEHMAGGVQWFELHNEPNVFPEWKDEWGGAVGFTEWAKQVISLLRAEFPTIKIISPGLGPAPNTQEWINAFNSDQNGNSLFSLVDGIGAHCYWANRAQMNEEANGRYYRRYFQYLIGDQKIWITEFSNNQPNDTDFEKGQQYVDFWYSLEPEVAGAFCFILSASNQTFNDRRETWVRNDVASDIVTAIAQNTPTPPTEPLIEFWSDATEVTAGNCTTIYWITENVKEVYLDNIGVIGNSSKEVCPVEDTIYVLRVVLLDGSEEIRQLLITVIKEIPITREYDKSVNLLPQNTSVFEFLMVFIRTFSKKESMTYSVDDALIVDKNVKSLTVYVWDVERISGSIEEFEEFADTYYPFDNRKLIYVSFGD